MILSETVKIRKKKKDGACLPFQSERRSGVIFRESEIFSRKEYRNNKSVGNE